MIERRQGESMSEERLSRLEAIVEALSGDIANITRGVENLANSVNKTDWSVLAAWAGVVMLVVGMSGSGYIRDLEKTEDLVGQNTSAIVSLLKENRSGIIEQAVVHNKEDLKTLDSVLQREMRLLDSEGKAQITALDVRLQTEMRLLKSASDVQLQHLTSSYSRALDWQDEHDKRVVGLNAAQWEQIRSNRRDLERIIKTILEKQ